MPHYEVDMVWHPDVDPTNPSGYSPGDLGYVKLVADTLTKETFGCKAKSKPAAIKKTYELLDPDCKMLFAVLAVREV